MKDTSAKDYLVGRGNHLFDEQWIPVKDTPLPFQKVYVQSNKHQ